VSLILFAVDDTDITFLKSQWDDLLSSYNPDKPIKDHSFQLLKEKYSKRGRFYHNLSHVKALLNLLESLNSEIQEHNAIRFSIWFHDVIYNTKRDDNEEESARLASEMLGKLYVNTETIKFVRDLVLATKGHSGNNLSGDAKLFLDADLAILGMSEEIYIKYSKAIREEYSWVPELMYRRSRKKILESFMSRERIYVTDELKERFEKQARKNITGEIKLLRSY
jgi:predicted metal-dependent HD superfamily phosphohydrolase